MSRYYPALNFFACGSLLVAAVPALLSAQEPGHGYSLGRKPDPPAHIIYVVGAVMNPGGYTLPSSEKTTVLQGVAFAGGLDKLAARTAIIIRHSKTEGTTEIRINLDQVLEDKAPNIELVDDDILFVLSIKNPEPHPRRTGPRDFPFPTPFQRNPIRADADGVSSA